MKIYTINDDYPDTQLIEAFTGQDALVSALPGPKSSIHLRMIDAAIKAGIKRFIPSEFGNNTCVAASESVPLYTDKAKVVAYLKSMESTGLTWTAIHTGQFLDWGLESGWFDFDLEKKEAVIYDSGNKAWSTSTLKTASEAVVKVLLKPEETKNRPVFVSSFTLSQRQLLKVLEEVTGSEWKIETISEKEALRKAEELDEEGALKLKIWLLLCSDRMDRGANFEKDGVLNNELLGLPVEELREVVKRIVKR